MSGESEQKARRCPRDHHSLKMQSFRGVEVEFCLECDGVWLDRGELARIAPQFDRRELRTPQQGLPRAFAVLRCPACGGDLLPRYFGSRKERVEMDCCVRCGGLWLDVGDMRRMGGRTGPAGVEPAVLEAESDAAAQSFVGFPRRGREWFVALTGMPLDPSNPVSTVPYVTWSLIIVNVAVFLYQWLFARDTNTFLENYSLITTKAHEGELYRYLTAMFLHANFFHLAANLFYLYTFGDNIEDRYGGLPYLLFYFACGLTGGVLSSVLAHSESADVPRVGASGAISGVLAAYLIAFPRTRLLIGGLFFRFIPVIFRLPVWFVLLGWVGLNVLGWVDQQSRGYQAVDYMAHMGGFLAGLVGGALLAAWRSSVSAGAEA